MKQRETSTNDPGTLQVIYRTAAARVKSWVQRSLYFHHSMTGRPADAGSDAIHPRLPVVRGRVSSTPESAEDWQEKLDCKIERAREIIGDNELDMKIFYLKRKMQVTPVKDNDHTE